MYIKEWCNITFDVDASAAVSAPQKGEIYIVNGKKVVYNK